MAKNWTYNEETRTLTRTYTEKVVDKETGKETQQEAAPALEIDLEDICPSFNLATADEVEINLLVNGLKQKMDDAVARSKDEKLTEVEKRDVQSALLDRLQNARKWNMEGKAGSSRGPSVPLKTVVPALVAANFSADVIAKMLGKDLAVVEKFIETGEED